MGAMNWAGLSAVIARTMMVALVGSVVSELTGGKFANRAKTEFF